jgi:hypothetical protein
MKTCLFKKCKRHGILPVLFQAKFLQRCFPKADWLHLAFQEKTWPELPVQASFFTKTT